jgi:predicted ATPase
MFRELRIENFKGFSSSVELDLAPITLIYGSNSAGKSAVLEALLLLSQSLRAANSNSEHVMEPFVFTGKHIDLGSFQNTVNGHNMSQAIKLGLSYGKRHHEHTPNEIESFDISVSWDHLLKRSMLDSCVYRVSTAPENTVTFKRDRSDSNNISVKPIDDSAIQNIADGIDELVKRKFFENEDIKSRAIDSVLFGEYQNWSFLPGLKTLERSENLGVLPSDEVKEMMAKEFNHRDWRLRLESRFASTRRALSSIRYIGPLRKSPTRFQVLKEQMSNYVGTSGDDVATILHRNPSSINSVNRYLEVLEIPYEVLVKRMDSDNTGTLGELIAIQLIDKRTNVVLSLEDVGFGISQVLPLLVQMAISKKNTMVVEQPELHLHPRLQANLADLLIEGAIGEQETQSIIETHSEHMILRIQRRIRAGRIKPEDVAIYYIDATDRIGSSVQRLHLDANGEFETPWPHGFFPERIDEILGS